MTDAEIQAARLGDGPRIAPVDISDVGSDLAAMLASMTAVNTAVDSREADTLSDLIDPNQPSDAATLSAMLARLPEFMRTMLHHPRLFTCLVDTGLQLLGHGSLPPRDRELAVLRIGWLCRAPYEWGEHVIIAKKTGITTAEVEAITTGSAAANWSGHDRAILRAVEELYADATISDGTWATLAARYDERQLIELTVVIGQYQAVAYYQNALRLRLHHDNPGLAAR